MRRGLLVLFALILFSSCCDEFDFGIDPEYKVELHSLKKNDTIYFLSDSKDLDTIRIIGIDSFRICPTVNQSATKMLELKIEHLPNNNWIDGLSTNPEGPEMTVINQSLISIVKKPARDTYDYWIHYREFSNNYDKNKSSNKIDTIKRDFFPEIDGNAVVEVYWSKEIGILGYKKEEGQTYYRTDQNILNPIQTKL
jgi:hypothetical protein